MINLNLVISIVLQLLAFTVYAGEVAEVCGKTGFPVLELDFRQGQSNFSKIKSTSLGNLPSAKYLKTFYSTKIYPQPEAEGVKFTFEGNTKFINDSDIKKKFLSFATTAQRLQNPTGFRTTLLEVINKLVPGNLNQMNWFLNLKDNQVAITAFQPATGGETGDVYGAVARIRPDENSKFTLKIIFSNNESEPLPYLIPLIMHELQHVLSYKEKIAIYNDEKKYNEYTFVEEAKAFDFQMQVYLALAKQMPEIFCNWLYVTWSYGEIPVPLSWTMASMEKEMASGRYIYNYAKMGSYKDMPYLLNETKTDLRTDVRDKIVKMKLKFVK